MKKYKLTEETKISEWSGRKVTRIEAIIDFGLVKAGTKGGFVEDERNLNVEKEAGNAWVYGDAEVSGNAWVSGNARVYGDAWVSGDARVYGNARVYGDAWVSGDARVYGDAWVSGDARVYGKIKCETGYYFAFKSKEWKVTEIELEDGDKVLYHE